MGFAAQAPADTEFPAGFALRPAKAGGGSGPTAAQSRGRRACPYCYGTGRHPKGSVLASDTDTRGNPIRKA